MKFEKRRGGRHQISASLSLTPLIDVVLLLLIFFMLSSSFILQPGIKVELPTAKAAESQEERDLTITITRANEIHVDDRLTPIDELPTVLTNISKERKIRMVLVKTDRHVQMAEFVHVLGICSSVGLERFGIATKPLEAE